MVLKIFQILIKKHKYLKNLLIFINIHICKKKFRILSLKCVSNHTYWMSNHRDICIWPKTSSLFFYTQWRCFIKIEICENLNWSQLDHFFMNFDDFFFKYHLHNINFHLQSFLNVVVFNCIRKLEKYQKTWKRLPQFRDQDYHTSNYKIQKLYHE